MRSLIAVSNFASEYILAEERRRRSGAYLMIHPRSIVSRWCNTLGNRAIFSLCGEPRGHLRNSIFLLFSDTGPIFRFFHCLSPQRWPELCHLLKMLYGVHIRRVSCRIFQKFYCFLYPSRKFFMLEMLMVLSSKVSVCFDAPFQIVVLPA